MPVGVSNFQFEMNDEFATAEQLALRERQNLFITGRAGTGKSTLLRYLADQSSAVTAVLAPTGTAALNVGGQTIHSFFRLPLGVIHKSEIKRLWNAQAINNVETVIIDEVSMVRADLMDAVDLSLRIHKNRMGFPFGGVQVVMFGDMHQLPPVIEQGAEKQYLQSQYDTSYFFSAHAFDQLPVRYLELQRIYRQHDQDLIAILNRIREGQCDEDDLTVINRRVGAHCESSARMVRLTATNVQAFRINSAKLAGLSGQEQTYRASIAGEFPEGYYPADSLLRLKPGAQIMMVRNDTDDHRWVNGEIGEVVSLTRSTIRVRLQEEEYEVEPVMWERFRYRWDESENKLEKNVAGTFLQYPVRLAWAVTIHKCQGQTLEAATIDLGARAFAHGQVYVALSRCRSLDTISLERPLRPSDVIFDPGALGYRGRFQRF